MGKRSSLFTLIFSFFVPGLGHLYKGNGKKTVIIFFAIVLLLQFLQSSYSASITSNKYIFFTFFIFLILFFPYILVDSVFLEPKETKLQWYNKWYFYLCYGLVLCLATNIFDSVAIEKIPVFQIPNDNNSMLPTLIKGDRIAVDINIYKKNKIERLDIVVFQKKSENQKSTKPYVRRVIGLPGDNIEIKNHIIYINGNSLEEPYSITPSNFDDKNNNYALVKVPAGHVYVLGDNRDKSNDSRFYDKTFVSINNIIGKVNFIYLSNKLGRIGRSL